MRRAQKSETLRWNAERGALVWSLVLGLLVLGSCSKQYSTIVVTGQVAKSITPALNTSTVLLGKATVQTVLQDNWMMTPDPGDTTFSASDFPAGITPIGDATVKLNSTTVGKRIDGVYFLPNAGLQYLTRYALEIKTSDGKTVTATGVLPDSFGLVTPADNETLSCDSVRAVWTRSDSANFYIVGVSPVDTASTAQGWSDSFRGDTTCLVSSLAFKDAQGTVVPGLYHIEITAVNGNWNKSNLELFITAGNIDGGVGAYGCAVYPKPVVFSVRQ